MSSHALLLVPFLFGIIVFLMVGGSVCYGNVESQVKHISLTQTGISLDIGQEKAKKSEVTSRGLGQNPHEDEKMCGAFVMVGMFI